MSSTQLPTDVAPAQRARWKWVLLCFGVALLIAVGVLLIAARLTRGAYPTTQTVERSFVIDEDFTKVRKILVRTDATKKIVTMTGDSEFIDQKWNTVGAGLEIPDLRDLKWRLELQGTLLLRTRDEYIGEHDIALRQDVKIDPDQIHSVVELVKPTDRLRQYEMTTWFQRQSEGRTLVRQRLKEEIVTDAPVFAHFIADRRVYQAAERALINQEQAIRQIVEENRDKRWLLLQ